MGTLNTGGQNINTVIGSKKYWDRKYRERWQQLSIGRATFLPPTTDTTFMRLLTHEKTFPKRNDFNNISPKVSTS